MKRMLVLVIAVVIMGAMTIPAIAAKPGFGNLFYEGEVVRTVVPPASMPKPGVDNFYAVSNGAEGQLGVAAVAPGDTDYHGGKWAFHLVEWAEEADPMLLTSEDAVLAAEEEGLVTVLRIPENDFKCPIQP